MRSIVYNDISKSIFSHKVGDLIFYFSSEFNKRRFVDGYLYYINDEKHKIENKYNIQFDMPNLLLISYYKKIEKRGYRVINNKTNELVEL